MLWENVVRESEPESGVRIQYSETCKKVHRKSKTAIGNMTGLEVSDVNISIAGVALKKENKMDPGRKGPDEVTPLLLTNTRRKPWEEEN